MERAATFATPQEGSSYRFEEWRDRWWDEFRRSTSILKFKDRIKKNGSPQDRYMLEGISQFVSGRSLHWTCRAFVPAQVLVHGIPVHPLSWDPEASL